MTSPVLIAMVNLLIVAAVLVLWKVPQWQVNRVADDVKGSERVDLEIKARSALAQILAGILLIVGVYSTWRSLTIARDGQLTDRFYKAVEQLGSEKQSIRAGGVYGLARIAAESPRDRWQIMKVLAAFVRDQKPWRCDPDHKHCAAAAEALTRDERGEPLCDSDLQAALSVLVSQDWKGRGEHLVLEHTFLRGADLRDGHLEGAVLNGSYLGGTKLGGAHLEDAHFVYACIPSPDITYFNDATTNSGTDFEQANRTGASGLRFPLVPKAR